MRPQHVRGVLLLPPAPALRVVTALPGGRAAYLFFDGLLERETSLHVALDSTTAEAGGGALA